MKLSAIAKKAAKELKWGSREYYHNGKHCMLGAIIHYRRGHEHCLKADSHHSLALAIFQMSEKESEMISIDKILEKNDSKGWNFTRFAKEFKKLGI